MAHTPPRPLHIRAVIPHFFREGANPIYGSGREGVRLERSVALLRCLHGLLGLRRLPQDLQLNLIEAAGEVLPPQELEGAPLPMEIEIHVLVCGTDYLAEPLALLGPQLQLHQLELEDPRQLALEARDWLVQHPRPADLNLYLEDDLVIHDRLLPEKMLWMAECSQQQAVLLPHRYETLRTPGAPPRLYVDGVIEPDELAAWHRPQQAAARGRFRGQQAVSFDVPLNPHAGCFGLSRAQVTRLQGEALPREGFVGPLETAATFTVGRFFTLLKPAWAQREFLAVEHGHPSFLGYLR
jgi:hypothetical protein